MIPIKRNKLVVFMLILIFGLVFLAAFIKKEGSQVHIELTVSSASFRFLRSERGPLFTSLPVKRIRLVHFNEVSIPFITAEVSEKRSESDETTAEWKQAGENNRLRIVPENQLSSIGFEDVRLNELNFQPGSQLTLAVTQDEAHAAKLTIDQLPSESRIVIGDDALVETQNCRLEGIDIQGGNELQRIRLSNERTQEIVVQSQDSLFTAYFEFPETVKLSERDLYVENISFTEQIGQFSQTSLVRPGKIIFKEFANKEVIVESHEFIRIRESEPLQVTWMKIQDNEIELVLSGRIDTLEVGTKDHLLNVIPSYLEWLSKKYELLIIFGALLGIMGFIKDLWDLIKSFWTLGGSGTAPLTGGAASPGASPSGTSASGTAPLTGGTASPGASPSEKSGTGTLTAKPSTASPPKTLPTNKKGVAS